MHYCRCYYCTPPSISSRSHCHVLATVTMPSLASLETIILVINRTTADPFPANRIVSHHKRTSRAMLESASLRPGRRLSIGIVRRSSLVSLLPADLTPANPPCPPALDQRLWIASYCNAHAMQCTHLTHGCAASWGATSTLRLSLPRVFSDSTA